MPFPFLLLAVSLSAGILAASIVDIPVFVSLCLMVLALFWAWLAYSFRLLRLTLGLILLMTFFVGFVLYDHEDRDYEDNRLRHFDLAAYADFTGYLYRSPSFSPETTILYLKVEKIRFQNREENIKGKLRVSVLHPDRFFSPLQLRAGDRVRIAARVTPWRDYLNFGEPRLASLRKHQRLHNQAICKSPALVEKLQGKRIFPIRTWISSLRLRFLRNIEALFRAPTGTSLSQEGAILEAMLLGERGRLEETTNRSLQQSGLYHLIAISGAHIAILSFLLYGALRLVRIPRRASYLALILLLVFYALLVEGRPSVFRATFMTLAYLVSKLFWKNVNVLNTISFSAFFLLLHNPFFLFDMGFELTFAATYAIVLFLPRVLKRLPRLPLRLSELFGLSLTAQLGVLPFLVHSFNRVTFSALVLNLAAVPLTGLIMGLGFLFLAFSLFSVSPAHLFGQALQFLIRIFLSLTHLLDFLPFVSYRIPTPHLATVFAYFGLLLLLLCRFKFRWQWAITLLCFLVCLTVLISFPFPAPSSSGLKLTFLDVGQGDSTLVQFPSRKIMLIDGGGTPDDRFDIGEHVVSPLLWKRGYKKIDYVVLTHAHPDHLNGLKAVARNFRVKNFWESISPSQNKSYRELKSALGSSAMTRRIFNGFHHREGEVRVEALHPVDSQPYEREVTNEESLVLRISMGEVSFLLAADIGAESESEIVRRFPDLRASVLKSPHHGSRTSSSFSFLEQTRPQFVVISAGRGNVYGVPHPDVLERYEKIGARILRTDWDGAIEIATDGRRVAVRTALRPGHVHNERADYLLP